MTVEQTLRVFLLLLSAGVLPTSAVAQNAPNGAALFQTHCAACHEGAAAAGNRAPTRAALAQKSQEEILRALESGPMVIYGNRMSGAERHAVAAFLSSNTSTTAALSRANLCTRKEPITPAGATNPENWDGWGLDVLNSRYQTHTSIRAGNVSGLKLKWAFGIPDASTAYGQPTVFAGRVFFGSGDGTVYALNAKSGCTLWTYKAETTVRTAITVAASEKGRYLAYFGDGEANLYAVNAESGSLVWKVKVGEHRSARITGAPQLFRNRLYVPLASNEELNGGDPNYPCCTFRGNVVAVDALTGSKSGELTRSRKSPAHRSPARATRNSVPPARPFGTRLPSMQRAAFSMLERGTRTWIRRPRGLTRLSLSTWPPESAFGCSKKLPTTFSTSAASTRAISIARNGRARMWTSDRRRSCKTWAMGIAFCWQAKKLA